MVKWNSYPLSTNLLATAIVCAIAIPLGLLLGLPQLMVFQGAFFAFVITVVMFYYSKWRRNNA